MSFERAWIFGGALALLAGAGGCGDAESPPSAPLATGGMGATGGLTATGGMGPAGAFTGGTAIGGAATGGAATGGAATGGAATGGTATGGTETGGTAAGGTAAGGTATGGTATGGTATGGTATGGTATGGTATGGTATGGTATGGTATGGTATGGTATGGTATGGTATGGTATGGTATGGSSGGNLSVPFILGADISNTQQSNGTFVDTDGQTKSIFDLLKNHGFNYIRLKTFVEPSAPYGYASNANGCGGLSEAYGDRDHVVAYGKRAKDAGMGFLLDFHYSDVWADPGNQIIPDPWRGAGSIDELAGYVRDYTADVIATAVAAGARPDMVQVGNEITPGMLMHVPGADTDCWGNNPDSAPIGGSSSNWDNLATLIAAGIEGVNAVDPTIEIVLHIENHSAAAWWVQNAVSRGLDFDILGLSCYTAFQGQPSVWETTFTNLAASYPDLDFIVAEYNPERTQANLIMKNLPNGQGRGTFFWEPTASGEWGDAMFTWQGGSSVANAADFAEFDALLPQLGL